MGPTQAAALVMQEQAKAEATRVPALRARGIAAEPRPAMEMAEAQQVIAFLMTDGVTGAMAFGAMAIGSVFSIDDRTPGMPRVGRPPSRACADAKNLQWAMVIAGGATALATVLLPPLYPVGFAWLAVGEATAYGFGSSWAMHVGLIAMFRDYYC